MPLATPRSCGAVLRREEFLRQREVARVGCDERSYHLVLNRYPVLQLHYLAVRPVGDPPATLPQALFGAGEIEEMLEELVIIQTNSRFEDRGATFRPEGLPVAIRRTNLGCWR